MSKLTHKEIIGIYSGTSLSRKPLNPVQPIESEFRETAGVYGWVVDGRVVYIGKTENFNNRMKTHVQELNRTKSRTGKYNKGVGPQLIGVTILYETDEVDQEKLSIAEQIAIDASGGISNLWNGRNEATRIRVVENIRRD